MADPDLTPYLVGLDLRGRRVLVVGGGSVAQRRVPRLAAAGADVVVVAVAATTALEGLAADGSITLHTRAFEPGDVTGAWYALACTDDAEVNATVVASATEAKVFCVRADDAALGSAVTPAAAEHDGLSLGVLARGDHVRSAAVRTAILDALQTGTVADTAVPMAAGVALVGGGPGDPDLITVRGKRLLARADVVVADRLGPVSLLEELSPHVEIVDASKIPYGRAMAQEDINAVLVDRARDGKFVVRLKGGDPYLFGRGYEEVLACVEAGVPVTVVPGITSAFAVPAAAQVPVTHRGVAHEVVVVSGHVVPEDPRSLVDWPALGRMRGTVVLMMAVERVERFASALVEHGRPADTPVSVIQEGTTRGERVLRATLADVAERVRTEGIRPPAIIVVGPVAGLPRSDGTA